MPNDRSIEIARALTRAQAQNPFMSEQGLEQPPEMKMLQALSQVGAGYGAGQMGGAAAQALVGRGLPALEGLGEAGALFPEPGAKLPPGITKADMLTPSERAYKLNEMNEKMYLQNDDFVNALKAKWGMLRNWGGN